jgi:D-glycero-alpha-D-manno-heptose 1-phosphate guanylyltransferase
MEVIILAGGKGTRLQTVVNDVPKPMAPINGKPFLTYLLNWITQYPVSSIILSVGYKASVIRAQYKSEYNNVPLIYAEEDKPLGTGGAIRLSLSKTTESNILIINGDTWFPISLNQLLSFHITNNSFLTLALKQMENFDRYGTVNISNKQIESFDEKKYHKKGLINGGIYALNKDKIDLEEFNESFSFEKEILEKSVKSGNIYGLTFNDLFIDIGIPEDYDKACKLL